MATRTVKRTTTPAKAISKKKTSAKKAPPVAAKSSPKTTHAKRSATRASRARTSTRSVLIFGEDEKRLLTLVSLWLALIAVFLGLVVYQIYVK